MTSNESELDSYKTSKKVEHGLQFSILREVPVQCCEPVTTQTGTDIVYPQSMAFAQPSIASTRTWSLICLALFHRCEAKKTANSFDSLDPKNSGKIFMNSLLSVR
jgi:hypothetical protein